MIEFPDDNFIHGSAIWLECRHEREKENNEAKLQNNRIE